MYSLCKLFLQWLLEKHIAELQAILFNAKNIKNINANFSGLVTWHTYIFAHLWLEQ